MEGRCGSQRKAAHVALALVQESRTGSFGLSCLINGATFSQGVQCLCGWTRAWLVLLVYLLLYTGTWYLVFQNIFFPLRKRVHLLSKSTLFWDDIMETTVKIILGVVWVWEMELREL